MKRRLLYFPVFLLAFLAACEQDFYDKGDGQYSYLRADFVEAFVDNDKQVDYVVTDDGVKLQLTPPYAAKWIQRPDTVYRAVLFYNYKDGQTEALSLARVSTLSFKQDSAAVINWKPDPVGVETAWLSGSKKYLNLGLVLMTGAVHKDAKPQSVGVLLSGVTLNADSTTTAHLLLNHRQGDEPEYYSQRTYLSIPLQGLEVDSLRLSIRTYDGVIERAFRVKKPER